MLDMSETFLHPELPISLGNEKDIVSRCEGLIQHL
jgi:hypothetical protein